MENLNKYKEYKENAFYCSYLSFKPVKKTNNHSLHKKKIKYEKVKE